MPKLCKRGIDSAKKKFKVYPSAYANAYASKVCKGKAKDHQGNIKIDIQYVRKLNNAGKGKGKVGLTRWFKEKWVNVCEVDSVGNYKTCGRQYATKKAKDYPFCRPLKRISKSTPKTVGEFSKSELKKLCKKKRSKRQGIRGKPTFIQTSSVNSNKSKKSKIRRKSRKSKRKSRKTKRNIKRKSRKSKSRKSRKRVASKKVQSSFKWISLSTANAYKNYAKEREVSKVARGEQKSSQTALGFMQAYNKAKGKREIMRNFSVKKTTPGNPGKDQTWAQRRNAFCKRHTAQQSSQKDPPLETKGKYKGLPTRRETGKIMWACSSLSESKLKNLLKKM